ncbi:hypothetical protein BCR43DRAFT_478654 [Syncephalastrum racemosum]|uniref:Methyltransferase FkbM domain-containing protein n=1 Tax=Syncephalastrum racemosum TaxID=13706 RepID=A0A1X2H569_SYNRA|nr:hypothetical protein BCR43DRAFT_478654 [Syncephalastrum racemosum]
MKWILRVYRRDPERHDPLLMVDAGSNHGLFSMVAGASGAHAIAFEPQTHLRSVITLGARLNQISNRLRVLPFAVLDKFRKVSMSKIALGDGGVGFLDYATKDSIMQTQTIRLDHIPAFDTLFQKTKNQTMYSSLSEIDPTYARAIEAATTNPKPQPADSKLLLRQPIHFLKIDVEGFELQALDSATNLFKAGLVEHAVLEFGPPDRWDVTLENAQNIELAAKRKQTITHAKQVLHRATAEWDMDLYLLPAMGWEKTVQWMLARDITYSDKPDTNQVVHKLMAWDFDGMPKENDEFEMELEVKENLVTECIPLPEDTIDAFMDDLQDIGEMYVWFVKRDSNPAIMSKLEL